MSTATLMTADDLLRMPDNGCRYALVDGEMTMMAPAGWRHGAVGGRLQSFLVRHVMDNDLGEIFLAETGFLLSRDPDTVRAPDIAFLRKGHLPVAPPEDTFWPGAPDLAVEVVSPNDTIRQVDDKVKAWLDGGAAMVWVVNPQWRSVTVYRSATDIKTFTETDDLTAPDLLPGFRCRVGEIFA